MSIVVAVRVRPFNQREKKLKSQLCVKMKNNTTTLKHNSGKNRNFTFDYSFWSHDKYKEVDGILVGKNDKYATQQMVYDKVGKQVLDNAINGYHCCLFAYGQTGSGKSYSMIGYEKNKGIVPIISEEIFNIVKEKTSSKKWYEVNISMLEIYNEKIQDLLIPIAKRPNGGLKVRQNKTFGVYVEKLSKHPVDSYKAIENKMSEGNTNRTIASTQMNSSSSRAHTIITIEFLQVEKINGKKVQRFSVINLVDLAGSEKVAKSGASGDRLKEGCSINKSLTVLGKVISTLADKALGKRKRDVVPYRESALTRILQNALGGNSKTLMICAISPSSNNYDETLSTLRYADQAKKIKCHAVINESEADKKIRQLQNENIELKKMIQDLQKGKTNNSNEINDLDLGDDDRMDNFIDEDLIKEHKEKEIEMQTKIKDLEETLTANNMMMKEFEKSFEEKLREEKEKIKKIIKKDLTVAHLTNLNEDPILSGQIYYNLKNINTFYIGRKNGDPEPNMVLMGMGVQKNHAIIERENDNYFLSPCVEDAYNFLFLNGESLKEKVKLENWDRIVIGITTLFIFKNPKYDTDPRGKITSEDFDWEHCQTELNRNLTPFSMLFNPEEEKKKQERYDQIERECERMKEEHEKKINQMETQHNNKMNQLEQQFSMIQPSMEMDKEDFIQQEIEKFEEFKNEMETDYQKQMEKEKLKKENLEKEFIDNFKEKDKKKLETKMTKINPNIIEVNLIAKELRRNIEFKLHISYFYIDLDNLTDYENKNKKYRIKVKVINHELGYYYFWDLNKFTSRYFIIKELLDDYYVTNNIPEFSQDKDPFWDPPEPERIGEGFLKLMSLAYLMDSPNNLAIVGDEGKSGFLKVNVIPCDMKGYALEENDPIFDEFIDDPNLLIGKRLDFLIEIK